MSDVVTRALLAFWLVPRIGPARLRTLLKQAIDRGLSPVDTAAVIRDHIAEHQAAADLDALFLQADATLTNLQQAGHRLISATDLAFPRPLRLDHLVDAPPLLTVSGNLDLIETRTVAVIGSRNAPDTALSVTAEMATHLAKRRITVVSGGAGGVDSQAHGQALDHDGATIMVIPQGILTTWRAKPLSEASGEGKVLIVSECRPSQPWSIGAAMNRNRLITALSAITVVITSGTSGGTYAAAMRAREVGHEVLVIEPGRGGFSSPGHDALVAAGARSLALEDVIERINEIFPPLDNVIRSYRQAELPFDFL